MTTCSNCDKPIRSLDGARSTNGGAFVHFDCTKAALIDYGPAFDGVYRLVREAFELVQKAQEPDGRWALVQAEDRLRDALRWGSQQPR